MCRALPLIASLGLWFSQSAIAQLPSFTFTQLNATFPDTAQTIAHGINDLGEVVGSYHDPTGDHGFVLKRGVYTSFDAPGAGSTIGFGINIWGTVVGRWDSNGTARGFLLSNGRFTTIEPPFPGVTFAYASGINAEGDVVGLYMDGQGTHGFLFQFGRYFPINVPFQGVTGTSAAAINSLGQIVGTYGTTDGKIHAFRDDWGVFHNIDGPTPGSPESVANGINDLDQVIVGAAVLQRGVFLPFTVQLSNVNSTNALGINNFEQIVGIYGTSLTDGQELSFLATPKR